MKRVKSGDVGIGNITITFGDDDEVTEIAWTGTCPNCKRPSNECNGYQCLTPAPLG